MLRCPNCRALYFERREVVSLGLDASESRVRVVYECVNCHAAFAAADLRPDGSVTAPVSQEVPLVEASPGRRR